MSFQTINPASGEVVQTHESHSREQIDEIIKRAEKAAQAWAGTPVSDRARTVGKIAEVLEQRKEELGRLITTEMGKPLSQAVSEVEKCAWVCRYYAEQGPGFLEDEGLDSDARKSYVSFEPIGLVLAVMPWNFPFWQVFRFAAPALTAGNGALLKHASNVMGCALAIEEVIRHAGVPGDVFRSLLISSKEVPHVLENEAVKAATLTGSEPAGRSVAGEAGKRLKKTVLELGGSDPYLILKDADITLAVEKCAASRLNNGGQTCIAAKRFIVVPELRVSFTEHVLEAMKARQVGDPFEEDTDVGPMAREDLVDDLHEQVDKSIQAGAKCLLGGERPKDAQGFFYPVTVLDEVRPGMPAFDEETFGPVAVIVPAEDEADAIRLANQSTFGLGAAVFSRDLERAQKVARQLEAGCVFINDFVKSDPRLPFGGVKNSGYGRELSRYGMLEFLNLKTIVVEEGG